MWMYCIVLSAISVRPGPSSRCSPLLFLAGNPLRNADGGASFVHHSTGWGDRAQGFPVEDDGGWPLLEA